MTRLRLPSITARTPEDQIQQLVTYLRQLVNDLNAVIDEIEMKTGGETNGK
jgi:hypothetical protein